MASTDDATLSLDVQLSPGANLTITAITAAQPRPNLPPIQLLTVPNVTIEQGQNVSLDLNTYFTDPDNDTLTYDFMNVPGVTMSVSDGILTITGVATGTQQSIVYASDLYSITQSNLFTITVTAAATNTTPNATENNTTALSNTSENSTANVTNETNETATPPVGTTENQTNSTANTTLDCSNPDPNQRPLACLQENASTYFNDSDKYWENLDRSPVAKFNALGNMLITGEVIEHAAGAPGQGDFALGYNDADGNFVATIWIDAQGNLHLKGTLHEEQLQLNPSAGSYSLITRRSLYIMYADTTTGDLYLRGNLIPGRRSIVKQ